MIKRLYQLSVISYQLSVISYQLSVNLKRFFGLCYAIDGGYKG
ncbi:MULTISPECIES: hypothetical protein [Microcystis]|nr:MULTISPECIES: hypothetical protein [Microcystis]